MLTNQSYALQRWNNGFCDTGQARFKQCIILWGDTKPIELMEKHGPKKSHWCNKLNLTRGKEKKKEALSYEQWIGFESLWEKQQRPES